MEKSVIRPDQRPHSLDERKLVTLEIKDGLKYKFRRGVAIGVVAVLAFLGAVKTAETVQYVVTPHEASSGLIVTGGEQTANDICGAAENLVGKEKFNKPAYLDDLEDFELPDGTPVKITGLVTPVSIHSNEEGIAVGFEEPSGVITSVDDRIEEHREQR